MNITRELSASVTPAVARPLLDAAFEIIARDGLQGLSLAAVQRAARRLRLPAAKLPRSRSELTLALLEDCRVVWCSHMERSIRQGRRGEFALIALFDGMARLFREREVMRGRLLLFFELTGCADAALKQAMLEAQGGLRAGLVRILKDGMRSGHFRSSDVELLAMLINATCRGIGYQWVLDPDSIDVRAALREVENLLVRALGPSERALAAA